MSQSAFEQYLKNSDYFRDVVNTHRSAVADVLAVLLDLMVDQHKVAHPVIDQALKRLDEPTGHPSVDVERRRLVALIRDGLAPVRQNVGGNG